MVLDSRRWDARYGWNLISKHANEFKDSIFISSPSAMTLIAPQLVHRPLHVEFQKGLKEHYLKELMSRLPKARQVVAVGGGNALDVGKYVAWKGSWPLIMIPTIVSTGALFQSPVALRRTDRFEWLLETVSPEYLLLDYQIIRAAPPHLNCSGMAECICHLAQLGAWRWWLEQGLNAPTWDQSVADEVTTWVHRCVDDFCRSLDENYQPTEVGIRLGAEINRERYDLNLFDLKVGHSLDHAFSITFEWVHGRELLHGEGVGLGSLINAFLYGWGFDKTKAMLEACHTRYRPTEIGCSYKEIRVTLDTLSAFADLVSHPENYFHHRSLDSKVFEQMMAAIEA